MPVFSLTAKEPDRLAPALQENYPDAFVEVWSGFYFVFDEATSKQVGDKLGITAGLRGNVFISVITGYWGYGPKDAWEWLGVKNKPSV